GDEAGAVVGHHDGVGGAAPRRVGGAAVGLGDTQVGHGRVGVGIGGAVVAVVGVGSARRRRYAGRVDQVARGARVVSGDHGEDGGASGCQVDAGVDVARATGRPTGTRAGIDHRPGG